MKYLKETTDWGEYNAANHTYLIDNKKCVGYIKEGTDEVIMFERPLKGFSMARRTFEEIKYG